eukprot:scaffold26749_cov27-Tisochrysis_lutea.AAC.4
MLQKNHRPRAQLEVAATKAEASAGSRAHLEQGASESQALRRLRRYGRRRWPRTRERICHGRACTVGRRATSAIGGSGERPRIEARCLAARGARFCVRGIRRELRRADPPTAAHEGNSGGRRRPRASPSGREQPAVITRLQSGLTSPRLPTTAIAPPGGRLLREDTRRSLVGKDALGQIPGAPRSPRCRPALILEDGQRGARPARPRLRRNVEDARLVRGAIGLRIHRCGGRCCGGRQHGVGRCVPRPFGRVPGRHGLCDADKVAAHVSRTFCSTIQTLVERQAGRRLAGAACLAEGGIDIGCKYGVGDGLDRDGLRRATIHTRFLTGVWRAPQFWWGRQRLVLGCLDKGYVAHLCAVHDERDAHSTSDKT